MLSVRRSMLAIVHGKRSQDAAILRGDRRRPASSQPMRKREMAVVGPQRVGGNIGDDDWQASVSGSATRSDAGADLDAINNLGVFPWQRRAGTVAQGLAVGIQKQNRAQQSIMLLLDVCAQGFQDFGKRC